MLENTADATVADRFLSAYGAHDWEALRELFTDDVQWTLPGTARISGTARGVDAILDRVQQIVASGVNTQLHHVLVGQDGITLSLRNTARAEDGRELDEHLATVMHVRDGRVFEIETYLSDVDGMIAFFGR